ncbi:two-component system, LytTR family, sensor histidine kinase AlgZ [Burkholderiales bacterium]|nr:two-component system, LytTR family, sensor histidine kinase AlgZ [Burkholderiales bacterium]
MGRAAARGAKEMASIIKQNDQALGLPDFRNLGIILRLMAVAGACAFAASLTLIHHWSDFLPVAAELAVAFIPYLVGMLLLLFALSPWLARLSLGGGTAVVVGLSMLVALGVHRIDPGYALDAAGTGLRRAALAGLGAAVALAYLRLRARALSPAIAEARLQALQARIRPHFLFNSLNAVLSLIRSDPRRAETALEDMADLFRVLMRDNRELTSLSAEVELCREYLGLEELRLGERLQVEWHIEKMPGDALVPQLLLQPLLENAVYHGIEPSSEPGVVSINIFDRRGEVHAILRNPYRREGSHHAGNKMALENIRERLALHFDAEASLAAQIVGDCYQVHIILPYRPVDQALKAVT